MLQTARLCVSLICACAALPTLSLADTGAPDARALLSAQTDNGNWILPARTYAGNRYTTLTQIQKTNVGELGQAN
jgi:glucose dehydrogenase